MSKLEYMSNENDDITLDSKIDRDDKNKPFLALFFSVNTNLLLVKSNVRFRGQKSLEKINLRKQQMLRL